MVGAFLNSKGGTGKSTSALNIGACLARLNKKVLLIDCDPQANLTGVFTEPESLKNTVYECLKEVATGKKIKPQDYLLSFNVEGKYPLSILPSSIRLAACEAEFKDHKQRDFLFKELLKSFTGYDHILVDCPPNIGLLTINVLASVERVFVPVIPEPFSLQGLSQISDAIGIISDKYNKKLEIGGIFANKFDNRRLHKDALGVLSDRYPTKFCKSFIRDSISLAESPSHGCDIFTYCNSKLATPAQDYQALTFELLAKTV